MIEFPYGYAMDLYLNESEYHVFGTCRADVDLSAGRIWEIYIRDMTVVDCVGEDVLTAYDEGEYSSKEMQFIFDIVRSEIYNQCGSHIVKAARKSRNYGT
jgi:hypothetical protein